MHDMIGMDLWKGMSKEEREGTSVGEVGKKEVHRIINELGEGAKAFS